MTFFTKLSGSKKFETLETSDHNLRPGDEIDAIVSVIHEWLNALLVTRFDTVRKNV
jgi:hypothetical protein